jgi:hypothetical protein
MDVRRGAPLVLGMMLALGPAVAWPDTFPEEELDGDAITAGVEIHGLARFPDHVFYLFPLRCSRALVNLDDGGQALGLEDLKVEDGVDDQPNYAELHDGPIASWIGGGGPCQETAVYAMAREVAATVDLAAMPLLAQQAFFADDSRLFRSDFKFVHNPPYASKGSPLRGVHEVVRALRIEADALVLVLDEATYYFVDGSQQTLKLAHTRRPDLPFRPMKPTKIEKYASSFAKWELRQPTEPPPAPKLPESFEETETGAPAEATVEAPADAPPTVDAPTPDAAPTMDAPKPDPPPTMDVPKPNPAPQPAAVPKPDITPAPAPEQHANADDDDDDDDDADADDEFEASSGPSPFVRRAVPLAIAVVVGLGAVIMLRRR